MFIHICLLPGRRAVFVALLVGLNSVTHALTFEEALRLAERQAPQVQATEQGIAAARLMEIPAGELPDPKVALGVDNLPIDGADQYSLTRDFMTMRRIGLMQDVPNAGKREARVAAAQGQVAVAEAQARVARLAVQRETAVAWIARESTERQLARIEELLRENALLAAALPARIAGGKAMAADFVAPRQEAAMIEERRDELNARREQAIAALRRWVGAAADAPLQGSTPDWPIVRTTLEHRLHQHPELLVFHARERVSDAEIAGAQAEKKPDWGVELAYQQRGPQYSNMVSLQFSFDLPVFTGSRQDPKIAAKRAERASLDAEREVTLREHAAMLESDFADYQRLSNAHKRQRDVLLPLAQERVDLATAAWRGGQGSLTDLIAARRERIDAELRAIALDGERRQVAARLHYAWGDDTPHETMGERP